jgi:hypothetical protein
MEFCYAPLHKIQLWQRYVSANAKVYMQILKANKLNKMNLKEKTL